MKPSFYVALESMVNEPPADDVETIVDSMDDAADGLSFEEYFQDVNELNGEIANDVADADRCIEVTQVLGELVNTVSSRVSEATPAEARLVELVGDMAVAGTDANPEDVVPSMEAYADGATSMQKVKENIAKMWAWVKQLIARIVAKITLFFKAAFRSAVALEVRLKRLKESIDKADGNKFKGGKIKLNAREAAGIATGQKVPASLASLTAYFSTLEVYRVYFFTTYHAYLVNRMTSLREAIDKFDLAQPDLTLMTLAERLKAVKFPEVPGLKNSRVAIMGQHQIVTENDQDRDRKTQAAAVSAGHYLEVSRKTVVELHRDDSQGDVKAAEIGVSNLAEIKGLVERAGEFIQKVEAFSQHPLSEIEAHQSDLTKALEKLAEKLQAHAEKDQGVKVAEHAFQLISNHVASVTSWIDQPLRAFTTYAIREAALVETIASRAFKAGFETEKPAAKKEGSQDYKPAGM